MTVGANGGGLPVPARLGGAGFLSPRLRARVAELGLGAADLAAVPGTGANGRVTVEDLEKYVADLDGRPTKPAPAMRVLVGDAMRRSWSRPLATVGRAARLDALLAYRKQQPDPKPGMVLYVIRALALALAEEPSLSGRLIGKRLVPSAGVDIGFAVEVDDGLMVPVLRGVDVRPVAELNAPYQELVAAARRRQLPAGTTGGAAAGTWTTVPIALAALRTVARAIAALDSTGETVLLVTTPTVSPASSVRGAPAMGRASSAKRRPTTVLAYWPRACMRATISWPG